MKKLVIGMVIGAFLVAASSVQAATVVEKDNFKYEIKGDIQIQLRQDPGDDQDLDLEYDDLEIKNKISYKLNDSLTAFGGLDFGFKNAADKSNTSEDPHLEEAYIGMNIDDFKIFFGKTDSAGDEFGVAASLETIVADDCFDEFGAVDGDDLIGVSGEFADMVSFLATYEIAAESEKSDMNGEFFDIMVVLDINNFGIGAAYQSLEAFGSTENTDTWGLQLTFDAGFAEFGADYSVTDDGDDKDESVWNIAAIVPYKPFEFGLGFVNLDDDTDDVVGWYANATYKFPTAKNVRLFAEISDSDEDDVDMGYMVGMRIKF
ncbi:MAG: porin [Desulfotignum sp.]